MQNSLVSTYSCVHDLFLFFIFLGNVVCECFHIVPNLQKKIPKHLLKKIHV